MAVYIQSPLYVFEKNIKHNTIKEELDEKKRPRKQKDEKWRNKKKTNLIFKNENKKKMNKYYEDKKWRIKTRRKLPSYETLDRNMKDVLKSNVIRFQVVK